MKNIFKSPHPPQSMLWAEQAWNRASLKPSMKQHWQGGEGDSAFLKPIQILWPWLSEFEHKMCNTLIAVKRLLMSWGGSNWIHTWSNTTTSVFWNIVNLTYAWPHVTSTRSEITKKVQKTGKWYLSSHPNLINSV